jgi:hypothetical protein
MMRRNVVFPLLLCCLAIAFSSKNARAQAVTPDPSRDKTWGTVTSVTAVAAIGTELLMPRIFYSDPEVTVGWKARWHVSVLAPILTETSLALLNEYSLKAAIKSPRPGCDASNENIGNCATYGGVSTHAFAASSALGNGVGVFVIDTVKWSRGDFNGGALAGNVIAPLIFTAVTAIGRDAGNFETTGQIVEGAVGGLVIGFLTGMTYSLLQRPECGYSGSLVCW